MFLPDTLPKASYVLRLSLLNAIGRNFPNDLPIAINEHKRSRPRLARGVLDHNSKGDKGQQEKHPTQKVLQCCFAHWATHRMASPPTN
ncbi:hypothetical protein [Bradyrhizobium zhanjiangense]|uniref:hypothetical protein n=1 Tax=Bradyrhizobium zhanjiangense TaxID=1325107 RepID=UPI0013E8DE62|nr:hypothetical protein [Bradyrhizobium zhanjiangense]